MTTVFQFLVIIGMFWLPESPEFYFAKGRFDESKIVLLRIARINGCSINESQICFDQVGKHGEDNSDEDETITAANASINEISQSFVAREKTEKVEMKHCKGTLRELWADKDLVINLFIMTGLWSITSFTFYLGKF